MSLKGFLAGSVELPVELPGGGGGWEHVSGRVQLDDKGRKNAASADNKLLLVLPSDGRDNLGGNIFDALSQDLDDVLQVLDFVQDGPEGAWFDCVEHPCLSGLCADQEPH